MPNVHRGHYAVAGFVLLVLLATGVVAVNARIGRAG